MLQSRTVRTEAMTLGTSAVQGGEGVVRTLEDFTTSTTGSY